MKPKIIQLIPKIGLGLRFDYTWAVKNGLLDPPAEVSESTKFLRLPSYPKPLFKDAMSLLSVQFFVIGGLQYLAPFPGMKDTAIIGYALCLPATMTAIRMILVARRAGCYEEFMGYTE